VKGDLLPRYCGRRDPLPVVPTVKGFFAVDLCGGVCDIKESIVKHKEMRIKTSLGSQLEIIPMSNMW
jgi:hypothetical protein